MMTFLLVLTHASGLMVGGYVGWFARRNWERNSWTTHADRITCPATERERRRVTTDEGGQG